jgi:hypothetical protein
MSEHIDRVRATLANRYGIERELGTGGMATVYLARDLKHQRQVAVKVLRPELATAVGPGRFLREIAITARLSHPHILPLLDSGEADDLLYYAMVFADGGSLRKRLRSADRLPLDEALIITRGVAAALDYAHRHGVIHRDIKPENILFSDGLALVADFGIAKAVGSAPRETLTRTGVPLGTPGYMSPEQAMGTTELDARTDVYSLACVVHEMVVGETPEVWPTDEDVRLGRFADSPPAHRARLDSLPGRVEQALVRALALRPVDRFAKPGDFADALAAAETRVQFSDAQVEEIIGRAAKLQAEHPTENGALTIGAIEQIAAEVGIPPEHVRQAVEELERTPGALTIQKAERVFRGGAIQKAGTPPPYGAPGYEWLRFARTVKGEVPESEYDAMVEGIQTVLGMPGHVSTVGKSLTWSPAAPGSEGRNLTVTIAPQAGQTRIKIEEKLELAGWTLAAPGWGAAGGGLFGILVARLWEAPEPYFIIPILIFAFWGGFVTANSIIWNMHKRRSPQLEALADRLAEMARPAISD